MSVSKLRFHRMNFDAPDLRSNEVHNLPASSKITSRDRVAAALSHREPDRVPIDFSGHRSSGIMAIAYARLRKHLGLPVKPIRVYDPIQQLAIVDRDVLDAFCVDTIELGRGFCLEDEHWTGWELPDGTPCLMPVWAKPVRRDGEWVFLSAKGRGLGRMPEGVIYFEQSFFPLLENPSMPVRGAFDECMWTAMASPPGPSISGPCAGAQLRQGGKKLRERTERAILGLFGGNLLEIGQYFFRNDNFLMLLAGEPQRAHAFLDELLEIHLANLDAFIEGARESIDVIVFGDDFGMQQGPQISPAMYREFFKPRQAILWRRVHQRTNAKVMLHCCGGVRELLPDMIEAGLDAINPVQITCRGMDAAGLKKDFGAEVTFWGGGCDTRDVLARGTASQVGEHVKRQIDTWRSGSPGGYVFQQVHNIMADVPPENIVAMFEAARSA